MPNFRASFAISPICRDAGHTAMSGGGTLAHRSRRSTEGSRNLFQPDATKNHQAAGIEPVILPGENAASKPSVDRQRNGAPISLGYSEGASEADLIDLPFALHA